MEVTKVITAICVGWGILHGDGDEQARPLKLEDFFISIRDWPELNSRELVQSKFEAPGY